ncbi:PepSY-associated TM helix domain-containing protein [Deinococcus misasensis]|uniref:PepSY-associated TM helix domain-containing protein n=1 Tax=Deinococcus misasensis TaxID=392413 RepID=UPI000554E40C|nr:PepSY domain-containing protein [Deinococcus misasensis]
MTPHPQPQTRWYTLIWRWHFYAGVYVVPFMLMLALTGLVILFQPQIEHLQYKNLLSVAPQGQESTPEQQLRTVQQTYPKAEITRYKAPTGPETSAQFSLQQDGTDQTVYVNPYTTQVLGTVTDEDRIGSIATTIHGTFLLGDLGDRLIEIAAGLGVVLLITGLYLWWPRKNGIYGTLKVRKNLKGRQLWRDLHAVGGFWVGGTLLFFLISGMAWTGIWGGKYVQAWNTFPSNMWNEVPTSTQTLSTLNKPGEKIVPWNLEQTSLPQSGSQAGKAGLPPKVTLSGVITYTRSRGLSSFWVAFPDGPKGVWTVSASTMSGDLTDARKDTTLHIDQYTGRILADIGWKDYSLGARGMAAGIALHEGKYGVWNQVLGALSCLLIVLVSLSGFVMWWQRRPAGGFRLAAPPVPQHLPAWKGAVALMLVMGVLFPLVGLTLLMVFLVDFLLVQRIPALKRLLA